MSSSLIFTIYFTFNVLFLISFGISIALNKLGLLNNSKKYNSGGSMIALKYHRIYLLKMMLTSIVFIVGCTSQYAGNVEIDDGISQATKGTSPLSPDAETTPWLDVIDNTTSGGHSVVDSNGNIIPQESPTPTNVSTSNTTTTEPSSTDSTPNATTTPPSVVVTEVVTEPSTPTQTQSPTPPPIQSPPLPPVVSTDTNNTPSMTNPPQQESPQNPSTTPPNVVSNETQQTTSTNTPPVTTPPVTTPPSSTSPTTTGTISENQNPPVTSVTPSPDSPTTTVFENNPETTNNEIPIVINPTTTPIPSIPNSTDNGTITQTDPGNTPTQEPNPNPNSNPNNTPPNIIPSNPTAESPTTPPTGPVVVATNDDDEDRDEDGEVDSCEPVAQNMCGSQAPLNRCDDDGVDNSTDDDDANECLAFKGLNISHGILSRVLPQFNRHNKRVWLADSNITQPIKGHGKLIVIYTGRGSRGSITTIDGWKGKVILCGFVVDQIKKIRGKLVLINSEVKRLEYSKGRVITGAISSLGNSLRLAATNTLNGGLSNAGVYSILNNNIRSLGDWKQMSSSGLKIKSELESLHESSIAEQRLALEDLEAQLRRIENQSSKASSNAAEDVRKKINQIKGYIKDLLQLRIEITNRDDDHDCEGNQNYTHEIDLLKRWKDYANSVKQKARSCREEAKTFMQQFSDTLGGLFAGIFKK